MLISGFTFIKNGLTLGYPIKESIESIAPFCDEIIINVGFDDPQLKSDDGTYEYLRDNFPQNKFIFIKNWWDPQLTSQGLILSEQTNLALKECKGEFCQYIQGDEALHETDIPTILSGVNELKKHPEIDGLIFKYLHFYGNVDAVLYTRRMYRREVRLIRNHRGIVSHLDAQGFRHKNGEKLTAKLIDATVYHYGWARKEQVMFKKILAMDKLYHGDQQRLDQFSYKKIWGIKPFKGTHPAVMGRWIREHKNDLDILNLPLDFKLKDITHALTDFIEDLTGYRIGEYKNYKLVR